MAKAVHVVCSNCDQINRIPEDRLADGARCGGCGQRVLKGKPIELNSQNFTRHTGKSDLPIVVDFWAPWCGPCRMMAPVFEQMAKEMSPRVIFAKVNTEVEQVLAAKYGIRSIPTLAIFRSGREVERIAGAMDASNLKSWIQRGIKTD